MISRPSRRGPSPGVLASRRHRSVLARGRGRRGAGQRGRVSRSRLREASRSPLLRNGVPRRLGTGSRSVRNHSGDGAVACEGGARAKSRKRGHGPDGRALAARSRQHGSPHAAQGRWPRTAGTGGAVHPHNGKPLGLGKGRKGTVAPAAASVSVEDAALVRRASHRRARAVRGTCGRPPGPREGAGGGARVPWRHGVSVLRVGKGSGDAGGDGRGTGSLPAASGPCATSGRGGRFCAVYILRLRKRSQLGAVPSLRTGFHSRPPRAGPHVRRWPAGSAQLCGLLGPARDVSGAD